LKEHGEQADEVLSVRIRGSMSPDLSASGTAFLEIISWCIALFRPSHYTTCYLTYSAKAAINDNEYRS
jgi:hypothetical protein